RRSPDRGAGSSPQAPRPHAASSPPRSAVDPRLTTPTTQRFYGWRITWALAVTQTIGYGVFYYTFSVFLQPMELELGWTRAQASGAFSAALLLSGLVALPIGRWVDARGGRLVMTVGSVI